MKQRRASCASLKLVFWRWLCVGRAHTPLFTAATLLRLPSLQMPSYFSQILNFILQSFNLENTHTNNDIVRSRSSIRGNFLSTLFSVIHNYSYSSEITVWKQAEHRLGLPLYTVQCVIISINSWLFHNRIILLTDISRGQAFLSILLSVRTITVSLEKEKHLVLLFST